MRHLFILVLLSLFAYTAAHTQTNNLQRFLQKYDTENGIIDLTINEDNRARGIKINATDRDYEKVKKEARTLVRKGNFEPLITVNRELEILVRPARGDKKEIVLLLNEEDKFLVLSYIGNFDWNTLSKISKEIDIEL